MFKDEYNLRRLMERAIRKTRINQLEKSNKKENE